MQGLSLPVQLILLLLAWLSPLIYNQPYNARISKGYIFNLFFYDLDF